MAVRLAFLKDDLMGVPMVARRVVNLVALTAEQKVAKLAVLGCLLAAMKACVKGLVMVAN